MPDIVEVRAPSGIGPLILGGLIVWLWYWWHQREIAQATASGAGTGAGAGSACGCCSSGQPPPKVEPFEDINATSGRYISLGGRGPLQPSYNWYDAPTQSSEFPNPSNPFGSV